MSFLAAHWSQLLTAALTLCEIVSLFLPAGNGTIAGIVSSLKGLGAKDVDGQ